VNASDDSSRTGLAAPTLPSKDVALDISGVHAGYGRTTVLRDVSLQVPTGAVSALLGPNGAGKTTLLRVVSGFLPVTRGSVSLFGDDITSTAAHRRFSAGLCHVPEGRGIFRSLSVRENIVMQSRRGNEAAAIERATTAFPILGERLGQHAGTLSGGQQQMLAVASAYVREPRLILVDEASLGLAPLVVDEIFAFLQQVTSEGTSALIVDQFAHRALEMASSAYVLNRGEITFVGTARDLLEGDVFSHYVGVG
jgi:branched-chain amino acid transport system ATP-binding protein